MTEAHARLSDSRAAPGRASRVPRAAGGKPPGNEGLWAPIKAPASPSVLERTARLLLRGPPRRHPLAPSDGGRGSGGCLGATSSPPLRGWALPREEQEPGRRPAGRSGRPRPGAHEEGTRQPGDRSHRPRSSAHGAPGSHEGAFRTRGCRPSPSPMQPCRTRWGAAAAPPKGGMTKGVRTGPRAGGLHCGLPRGGWVVRTGGSNNLRSDVPSAAFPGVLGRTHTLLPPMTSDVTP